MESAGKFFEARHLEKSRQSFSLIGRGFVEALQLHNLAALQNHVELASPMSRYAITRECTSFATRIIWYTGL